MRQSFSIFYLFALSLLLITTALPLSAAQKGTSTTSLTPEISEKVSARMDKITQRIEKRIEKKQRKASRKKGRSKDNSKAAMWTGILGLAGGIVSSFFIWGILGFLGVPSVAAGVIAVIIASIILSTIAIILGIKELKKKPKEENKAKTGVIFGILGLLSMGIGTLMGFLFEWSIF